MSTPERLAAESDFEDEIFAGLELPGASFTRKQFYRCTFRNLKLGESVWTDARLEDCVFEDCDLTGFKPTRLSAWGIHFKGCKLMGVDWTALAANPRLEFTECNLRYSSFTGLNLKKTKFLRCRATEANFIEVDLTEADFSGTDLTGSTLRQCQLKKANFAQATGAFIDPGSNRVKEVSVSLETAVLLALSLGMKVSGFGEGDEGPRRGKRQRE